MYCRKCGTYINGDAEVCEACRGEMIAQIPQSSPRLDMSAEGRGTAICSAVLGGVSWIPMLLCVLSAGMELPGIAVIAGLGCLACIVISVINGIRGIRAFRSACRQGAVKPIVSLVCGIAGTALSGMTVYLFVYCLWVVAMVVSQSGAYYY